MFPNNPDDAGINDAGISLVTNMPECSHHHLLGLMVGDGERAALICCHDDPNERTMTFELPEAFVQPGDGETVDQFYARTTAYLDRMLKAVFN